ncbi:MAG: hypothetical protein ACI4XI_05095 [Ruminococcus sp.]
MKTELSNENKQEKLCGRKGEVRLYNMILPPFMLMMFSPLLWFISLAGNFIIDSAIILIISLIIFRKISGEFYKKSILKVWLLGFASDFIGVIYLFCVDLAAYSAGAYNYAEEDSVFRKYLSGANRAFSHCDTSSFWAVVYLASGILVAAIFIFLFNYFISFRKTDLTKKQKLFSSMMLAVCTAPYTLLLPSELFY